MRRSLPAAALILLLAVACGSAPPPTAHAIAAKLAGCGHWLAPANGPSAYASTETTCQTPYAWVDLATFTTPSAQMSWIRQQQAHGTGTCCLDGHGWAADVQFKSVPANPWQVKVQRALGGRWVSVP